jgi:tetratricopeptide (TPR) repeat protein
MLNSATKDLRHAENLRREGKLEEALKIINEIEKKGPLTPNDQLTLLISKGNILSIYQRQEEAVKIGDLAYRLSQSLGRPIETIISLVFKANSLFLGQYDEALNYLVEAENLLNSLEDVSPQFLSRQKRKILFRKAWAYLYKGEYQQALKFALECLDLQEKFGYKSDISYTLQLLGTLYSSSDTDLGIDYISRSLSMFEDLGDQVGIATSQAILGQLLFIKGNLDLAEDFSKKSLSVESISPRAKLTSINSLGQIFKIRGELDKALKYFKQGIALAENKSNYDYYIDFQAYIGSIYFQKGENDIAIEFLKPSLSLAEKIDDMKSIFTSLTTLVKVYLKKGDYEEVQEYLDHFDKFQAQLENKLLTNGYKLLKAAFLKEKGGSANRAEAEKLLKFLISDATYPDTIISSLIYLCEFYLEELNLFEDPEVLKKVSPLIERLYKISKEQRMYGTISETKLLQAKVALIQMDFEETERLLTQAQRVAELYGISLTAQKISSEHDNYLVKLNEWKRLKDRDAPLSERLKLAEVDSVIERLQGKRPIEPPELVEEEPIVLLIIDKSGISYFNYPFKKEFTKDWLFSSFMSAFNTFSSEVFEKSIDRIMIDENKILINSVEQFLVCYVIKGQSYPGLQKLNRFSKAIKDNTEIWESLTRAAQTGEVLEIDKPQSLGIVVNEIFTH